MTLFVDFMISKGYITASDAVSCLVAESDSSPSVSRIIHEKSLLSPEVQLEILKHQALQGVTYREAALTLGHWTTDIATRVQTESCKSARSFLNQLVDSGLVPYEKVTAAMDDFIAAVEDGEISLNQPVSSVGAELGGDTTTYSESSPAHPSQATADEPQLTFSNLNQGLLEEYLALVTESQLELVKGSLEASRTTEELELIEDQMNAMSAGAKFVGASLSHFLLGRVVEVLEYNMEKGSDFNQAQLEAMTTILTMVGEVARHLATDPDEEVLWQDEKFKQRVLGTLPQLSADSSLNQTAA